MKFSIKDFFSKCEEIRWKLRIWSRLLKKSFMDNFIFCAVIHNLTNEKNDLIIEDGINNHRWVFPFQNSSKAVCVSVRPLLTTKTKNPVMRNLQSLILPEFMLFIRIFLSNTDYLSQPS